MNVWKICILWLFFHHVILLEVSSSEKNKKEEKSLVNEQGKNITRTNPNLTNENCYLVSYINEEHSYCFNYNPVPSTSTSQPYFLLDSELAANIDCKKTIDKESESATNRSINENIFSSHYTTDTISTSVNIPGSTLSIDLSTNVSSENFELGEFVDSLDFCNYDDFEELKEYLIPDIAKNVGFFPPFAESCANTFDEVLEVIDDDLKNNDNEIENFFPTHVESVNTTENNESTVENVKENNKQEEMFKYVLKWKELFLSIKQKKLENTVDVLKHIHGVMAQYKIIDSNLCTKGLHFILKVHKHLLLYSSFAFKPSYNFFLNFIRSTRKNKTFFKYDEEVDSSFQFVNSFSMYWLCLFLMLMAPTSYIHISHHQRRSVCAKEKYLKMDIKKCFMNKKISKNYLSWCNKLRWSKCSSDDYLHIPLFTYVLFECDSSQHQILQKNILKYSSKTVSMVNILKNEMSIWFNTDVNNEDQLKAILKSVCELKSKAHRLNTSLNNTLQIILQHLTSNLENVKNITAFSLYWLGILCTECVGVACNKSFNAPLAFYLFNKFVKECETNMTFAEMTRHEAEILDETNLNMLPFLFMFVYMRVCEIILLLIINLCVTVYTDLVQLQTAVESSVNKKKNIMLEKIDSEFTENIRIHLRILFKINEQKNKIKRMVIVRKLIQNINKKVDYFKQKIILCKQMQNDKFKTDLKEQYEQIVSDYRELLNVLKAKKLSS